MANRYFYFNTRYAARLKKTQNYHKLNEKALEFKQYLSEPLEWKQYLLPWYQRMSKKNQTTPQKSQEF